MKMRLISAALIAFAGSALAEERPIIVTPDALTWKDHPALPKGAQVTVLVGDPTKQGELFVQRVKLPANYQIPAHTHPSFETVTVVAGSIGYGMGEKLDKENGKMLQAGSLFTLPAGHPHYVWTAGDEATLQVQAIGPAGITYINAADDPRKERPSGQQ
jgi:quercetin dioxygenase-like cupin family protein